MRIEADHSDVVAHLLSFYRPRVYLELGVSVGKTFNKAIPLVQRAIGVDKKKPAKLNGGEFHECSTTQFFEKFSETIDFAFIDADHKFESARLDFIRVEALLSLGGVILLHDVDPEFPEMLAANRCHDSYRMIDWLRKDGRFAVFVLPVRDAGLALVQRFADLRFRHLPGIVA